MCESPQSLNTRVYGTILSRKLDAGWTLPTACDEPDKTPSPNPSLTDRRQRGLCTGLEFGWESQLNSSETGYVALRVIMLVEKRWSRKLSFPQGGKL